ncbi:hypothetical protein ACIQMV_33960 [Streptomyces sp. NPDC091412]|uniref:hypothetical protein n=1 Tax=Streptomyces sp. NPDC091412 TaxID=3366002 RepID=UPI00382EF669
MSTHPETITRTVCGKAYTISRRDIHAAAARLRPLHQNDLRHGELFILVGSGLYYGPDLIEEATGGAQIDGCEAYDLLGSLGLPLFRWDWGNLKDTRNAK